MPYKYNAIDRRIYEIARKHCGNQLEFTISLEKLHLKAGSSALLKMFRHNVKQLAKGNDLPDYSIKYDAERDVAVFTNQNMTPEQVKKEEQREQGKRQIHKIKKELDETKRLRAKVLEALDDTRPTVSHQQVMDEAQALINRKYNT